MADNTLATHAKAPRSAASHEAAQDESSALAFLRSESLTTVLQEKIERMILGGELKAGERINELALAQAFGVSRSPIREACRKLEQAGMVEIIKNRGMFVCSIDVQRAMDIYEIRGALAGLAGKLIVQRASDDDIAALRLMVQGMKDTVRSGGVAEYYRQNIAFHSALVRCTGNQRLVDMFLGTDKELHLYRHRSLVQPSGIAISNQEHDDIVEAIAARDAARAGRAFKRHVLNGKARALAAATAADAEQGGGSSAI
ncbi:GntR family transcriptional regulator [Pollutimonas sp. M17]|uniref:GntR family transcriptional regulator n=1 Tax=Pollutimonas sp. M17 TaxID=2962065 RepID=UPI0021F4758C|nr:GntR family transcriptional regulator [Pollutimonas sp. M17]UYO92577.1 GntR family transcriptional regulator [Pollutimonas sp. M17]